MQILIFILIENFSVLVFRLFMYLRWLFAGSEEQTEVRAFENTTQIHRWARQLETERLSARRLELAITFMVQVSEHSIIWIYSNTL